MLVSVITHTTQHKREKTKSLVVVFRTLCETKHTSIGSFARISSGENRDEASTDRDTHIAITIAAA